MSANIATTGLTLLEGSSPGAAREGRMRLYPNSDGYIYGIDDAGTITRLDSVQIQSEQDAVVEAAKLYAISESFKDINSTIQPYWMPMPDARSVILWTPGSTTAQCQGAKGTPASNGTITNTTTQTDGFYGTFLPSGTGFANRISILLGYRIVTSWNTYFYARINTNNIIGGGASRLWLGLASSAAPDSADLGAVAGMCFLLDTGASNVFQYAVGNGTTKANTSSGVTAVANTIYELELWTESGNAWFSINHATPVNVSSNIPSGGLQSCMSFINDAGSIPTLWMDRFYTEHN